MNFRYRIFITAVFLCHLLLIPALVTSQTPSPATLSTSASSGLSEEEVTIRAVQQEKDGPLFKLRGQAEIHEAGMAAVSSGDVAGTVWRETPS